MVSTNSMQVAKYISFKPASVSFYISFQSEQETNQPVSSCTSNTLESTQYNGPMVNVP